MKQGPDGPPRRRRAGAGRHGARGTGTRACGWPSRRASPRSSPAPSTSTAGVSPQECITPVITVAARRAGPAAPSTSTVALARPPGGCRGDRRAPAAPVDIRRKAGRPGDVLLIGGPRRSTRTARRRSSSPTRTSRERCGVRASSLDAEWPAARAGRRSRSEATTDGARRARPARRRGVPRQRRPQGPGAQVQGPVPGPDLRRRVPPRPLLREHRRAGDRRGPRDRPAPAPGPDGPRRRAGAVQVAGARARHGQAHRPRHRAPRRRRPTATSRPCPASSSRTCASATTSCASNERMLTGGFYAEIELEYDAAITEEAQGSPVRDRRPAADPAVAAGHPRRRRARVARALHLRAVARPAAAQHRLRARGADRARPGRAAAADGPVRRAQLQHRRARTARHRQVAPVPADLAVLAPRLGRQGDRGQDVRRQLHRAAAASSPSTTSSASTRSAASTSTRRTASTSSRATWSPASSAAARSRSGRRAASSWSATSTSTSPTSSASATSSGRSRSR